MAGAVGVLVLFASSCSPTDFFATRVEGRAEQETELSDCEAAYQGAQLDDATLRTAISSAQRAMSNRSARQHWLDVAANCTGRFAEGSMNSALASFRLSQIESSSAFQVSLAALPSDAIASSGFTESKAAAIALSEDRTAFGMEVLAARNGGSANLLALSDNHKSLAQSLVALHPKASDPRERVYSVQNLLSHPQTITDPSTGLEMTSSAQLEMDNARAIIEAVSSTQQVTDNTRSAAQQRQALQIASQLAASRAFTAFALGYPAFNAAVLRTES